MDTTTEKNYCSTCLRPLKRCLCSFVKTVKNDTPVFILQHSKERFHPKGTAQLAHLCLEKSQIISNKAFHKDIEWLLNNYSPALLWPKNPIQNQDETLNSESNNKIELSQCDALIVIDGTWKKANKLFITHPELHRLTRCDINGISNQYDIRKSPSDGHLSTLEAIHYGLQKMDNHNVIGDGLLEAQNNMIKHWQNSLAKHQVIK